MQDGQIYIRFSRAVLVDGAKKYESGDVVLFSEIPPGSWASLLASRWCEVVKPEPVATQQLAAVAHATPEAESTTAPSPAKKKRKLEPSE